MTAIDNHIENLPASKRALFELLLQEKRQKSVTSVIPRNDARDAFPLSFAQQRLWFLHQLDPGGSTYNMPACTRLIGQLDIAVLERTLAEVVRRHAVLRTIFPAVDGQPVQVILPPPAIQLAVTELQTVPVAEREDRARQLVLEKAHLPLDLANGPLLHAGLIRLNSTDHLLYLTIHHIASDGWSIGVLIREVSLIYAAFVAGEPARLPELPIQYADYATWQQAQLTGEQLAMLLAYWKQRLAGAPSALALPTDRPRPSIQTIRGAIETFSIPTRLYEGVKELCRQEHTSLFMTLLAVFKVLLFRYSGQHDIVVGSPTADRRRTELEGLIGCFVNTLVLRSDLSGNPTGRDLLARIRETALDAYAYQDLPFEKLVEELRPERDLSYSPLFQIMFILQNAPVHFLTLPGLTLGRFEVDFNLAQFDITFSLLEKAGELQGMVEYNTDLFDKATICRMVMHYRTLLDGVVANPDQRILDLPLITASERQQLLIEWNNTNADYPRNQCVHQLFEAQVRQTPTAPALIYGDQRLSYHELNAQADQLAGRLRQLGVRPETPVGIYLDRSPELLVGILGVLKAGGAYVPLDPNQPRESIAWILEDTGAPILLTQAAYRSRLPLHQSQMVWLNEYGHPLIEIKPNPTDQPMPENSACIIYTSGSSGKPKGVLLHHGGLTNMVTSFNRSYHPDTHDRILPLTAVVSASFVGEIFPLLCAGGCLVLPQPHELLDHSALLALIARQKVTIMSTVPTLMARLNAQAEGLPHLRLMLSGGEALNVGDIDQLQASATIVNGYGLTETSVCSTFYRLDSLNPPSAGVVSIGAPVINHQVYVLDQHLTPLPIGCPGELYIAGDGLARGYLNNPRLTAERFIPNPFTPGQRMYRTGDLARWQANGTLEYLGRADQQVKIRGFRVELGAIEAVLSQHPATQEATVIVREDTPGEKRLIAYVVPCPGQKVPAGELRNWLRERLPDYMVPAAFEALPALPLTVNGKVDVGALPAPSLARPQLELAYIAPQTDAERAIATVWREVLDLDEVGIHDNFFDLGGHSLLLAQVHSRLREQYQWGVSLVDLFKYATISALARHVSHEQNELSVVQLVRDRALQRRQVVQQRQRFAEERRMRNGE